MRLGFGKQGILLGLRNVGAVQAGTGQTFEDDRQFLLPRLVHQQIHAVIRQHAGLIGLAVPFACLLVFGAGSFLIPSMVCILALLLVLRKPIERSEAVHRASGEEAAP